MSHGNSVVRHRARELDVAPEIVHRSETPGSTRMAFGGHA